MILDIPTENDFCEQGFLFLNLAWDSVIDLLSKYKEVYDLGRFNEDQYWAAAQVQLAAAVALSQQGAEFLLKSKISKTSSLLLLSGNPDNWPKKCEKENTFFSEFRTADAQDLIKIHDTVAEIRLSENFIVIFSKLRKIRNSITHTVNKRLFFTGKDIIVDILNITSELIGKYKWIELREEYIKNKPSSRYVFSSDFHYDYVISELIKEMVVVVEFLENKQLVDNFNFSKKKRRYYCPDCYEKYIFCYGEDTLDGDTAKFAQLQPNTPESTNLWCFICRKNIKVERKKCNRCEGNVINNSDSIYECLTCLKL